ncbi:MAG: hypothetical protein KF833_00090 [Verrucomicrobiae bacterium]|nr:hypothetical protein [Verrucomicrobiae bacterium]
MPAGIHRGDRAGRRLAALVLVLVGTVALAGGGVGADPGGVGVGINPGGEAVAAGTGVTGTGLQAHGVRLEMARTLRASGHRSQATRHLTQLLESDAPDEIHRAALLELAGVAQDEGQWNRVQQILSQYVSRYPRHPSTVEVLLRQGDLYRRAGANGLALSKYYAVMTSALSLRVDQLDLYQRLVLEAQIGIADTHYLAGRWKDAADFLRRLLRLASPHLDRAQVRYKLIRALSMMPEARDECVAQAELYLESHGGLPEASEVRFLLAGALKEQGRNADSLRQVLRLLEVQRAQATEDPRVWAYWQKRAGNKIGNQLYQEGDYLSALAIFERLAVLDDSPEWQLPLWYQIGLVYERLEQPGRASATYSNVVQRGKGLEEGQRTPDLRTVLEMAQWRADQLGWLGGVAERVAALRGTLTEKESLNVDEGTF